MFIIVLEKKGHIHIYLSIYIHILSSVMKPIPYSYIYIYTYICIYISQGLVGYIRVYSLCGSSCAIYRHTLQHQGGSPVFFTAGIGKYIAAGNARGEITLFDPQGKVI
jgi:hypothetical protein